MKRSYIFIIMFFLSILCFAQQNAGIKVIGRIPDATDNRLYQMQVGAFRLIQNASNAFEKLRAASLNPCYEGYMDLTRVVIKGVSARDVSAYIERVRRAGFSEVFIKIDPACVTTAWPPVKATAPMAAQPSTTAQPLTVTRPSTTPAQPSTTAKPSKAAAVVPKEDIYLPESQALPQYDGSEEDFPKTGLWKLTGNDPFGTEWEADLVITNVQNDIFNGYFDWYMVPDSDYMGKEYFTGSFDNTTDKVYFQGTKLENSKDLVLGKYEAYVTPQRDKLYNGRWEEEDDFSTSNWQAAWEEEL